MASWTYPPSEVISGTTKIRDADDKLANAMIDLTAWVNGTTPYTSSTGATLNYTTLNDMTDTDVASATNSQALVYNSTSSKWENSSVALGDSSDVTISSIIDGQIIAYNSTSTDWENVTLDKTLVGLSNVDNTSDASKPVSTAQQSALDLKANLSNPSFTGSISVSGNVDGRDVSADGIVLDTFSDDKPYYNARMYADKTTSDTTALTWQAFNYNDISYSSGTFTFNTAGNYRISGHLTIQSNTAQQVSVEIVDGTEYLHKVSAMSVSGRTNIPFNFIINSASNSSFRIISRDNISSTTYVVGGEGSGKDSYMSIELFSSF